MTLPPVNDRRVLVTCDVFPLNGLLDLEDTWGDSGFAKFHEIQGFSAGALVLFGLGFGLTALCIIILAVQEMRNLYIQA